MKIIDKDLTDKKGSGKFNLSKLETPEADNPETASEHYLKLMLAQDRRLEKLESEYQVLQAECEELKEKNEAQADVIRLMKSKHQSREATSRHLEGGKVIKLDLPEFDESEFQPVQDIPPCSENKILMLVKDVLGVIRGFMIAGFKKFFAILT